MNEKPYKFVVKGGFDISSTLAEYLAWDGGVIGFVLPNGKVAKLCVALEIEDGDGDGFTYVTSQNEMAKLGFQDLDYESLDFHEDEPT